MVPAFLSFMNVGGGRAGTVRFRADWLVREVHVINFWSCRVAHGPGITKYTARPPSTPCFFGRFFVYFSNNFTIGNEREMEGRNAPGGDGGSNGVLWMGRRVPGRIIVCVRFILRRRPPASSCQTPALSAVLRRENDDPGLPSLRPGIHSKTEPWTERGYRRLFAG